MSARALLSVIQPQQPQRPQQVEPLAKLVQETPLYRLWTGQSLNAETHQVLAYLAGRGYRIPTGIGVTLVPLRHPFDAAVQARSLGRLTGKPIVVGYGPATPGLVASLRGEPYATPARTSAEYARAVRDLLDGGPVAERTNEAFHLGEGISLQPLTPEPRVEVGMGVLRPGMARKAGGAADVAISWLTPANYVRDTIIPKLAEGAEQAGRDRTPRVATMVHAAVARPARDPRKLAMLGAGSHLGLPHYTDMLRQAGVPAYPDRPQEGAAAILDKGVYLYGSPEEIAKGLLEYEQAGVSEIVLNPAGVVNTEGVRAAVADVRDIVSAWEETRV
ncbi:LLM class flavin-dependent oxidoreductase [Nocardiopsis ganjiahuensis]|uniref:LLM class flavin-dependent oxidoreductase n=1 Tax=Nocardiopsis ganjiahuensis TaxID=239984 RepID=UPI000348C10A|nr:LLM class flavin-dependent oxidoreductase [Nocardiopsis ganjiahuensis]